MRRVVLFMVVAASLAPLSADDGSARRYASLQTDSIVCRYFLLSANQVQQRLHLTQPQIQALEAAMRSPTTAVPGMGDLRRSQAMLMESAVSDDERRAVRRAGSDKASRLIHENWEATLQHTLSPTQAEKLGELLLQMRGPIIILEDTNISAKLELSSERMSRLAEVRASYSSLLSSLRHRLVGLQVQPSRNRERGDVESEMQSLVRIITETERDQDSGLLGALNTAERRGWTAMCGQPVSIDWEPESFASVPFGPDKAR